MMFFLTLTKNLNLNVSLYVSTSMKWGWYETYLYNVDLKCWHALYNIFFLAIGLFEQIMYKCELKRSYPHWTYGGRDATYDI